MSEGTQNVADKLFNKLKNYSKFIYYAVFFFVIIVITIIMSENYRVNKAIKNMDIYRQYLVIDSKLNSKKLKSKRLCDFHIASSYRSCIAINQRFDYVSVDVLTTIMESGARLLWFDIFNDNMSNNAQPIVSNGRNQGNWRYSLNSLHFDDVIKRVSQVAFNSGYVNNYNDPLILALNLNVQNNLVTLNRIKKILVKRLKNRLLPSRYGYISKNMAEAKIEDLLGKVIIITSAGYEDSDLTEIINDTWNKPHIRVISYKGLSSSETDLIRLDKGEVKEFNSNNLSIVIPEENSIFTSNYDPRNAFDTGCQFICMNYQKPDRFMDDYITKFKETSFLERDDKFLGGKSYADQLNLSSSNVQGDLQGSNTEKSRCPNEPQSYTRQYDEDTSTSGEKHIYKKETDNEGLCFFSTTSCNPVDVDDSEATWKEYNADSLSLALASPAPGYEVSSNINNLQTDRNNNPYKNWAPKICCSKKKYLGNNELQSKHVISKQCVKPDEHKGSAGLKISNSTIDNVNIYKSENQIIEGDYQWVKPELCGIEDERNLRTQQYCTLSANTCPDGWNGNIELENGWKMCCKNTN